MIRFLKSALKWGVILAGIYAGSLLVSGMDFESRTGWFFFGIALAVAYVDGSLKDRISSLEYKIEQMDRQLNGRS